MSVSGKYMTATLEGIELSENYGWDVDEGGDVLDRTVGADNGKENEDMGVEYTHITIDGYCDDATLLYSPIRRGQILTNLLLYRNAGDGTPMYSIELGLVTKSRITGKVRDRVTWQIEVHSKGDVVTYLDP